MELIVKKRIIQAAMDYASDNDLKQTALAKKARMNEAYISAMFKGNFFIENKTSGKKTKIKDSYFKKLAKTVGYKFEKTFWELVETSQYIQIYTELLDARSSGRVKMLIGETGCGKTYTIDHFVIENPTNVYRITVSSLHNLNDIINELSELLNITPSGSRVARLKKIAAKFHVIKLEGGCPVLILDEAENLRIPALKMLKALYDAIRDFCPIVMIGTEQLSDKLDILSEKNVEGIPQFVRRVKAGRRNIVPISKKMFEPFLSEIQDEDLKVLIESLASNYGELNDYVEPALREAAISGRELTEKTFRFQFGLIHNRAI